MNAPLISLNKSKPFFCCNSQRWGCALIDTWHFLWVFFGASTKSATTRTFLRFLEINSRRWFFERFKVFFFLGQVHSRNCASTAETFLCGFSLNGDYPVNWKPISMSYTSIDRSFHSQSLSALIPFENLNFVCLTFYDKAEIITAI